MGIHIRKLQTPVIIRIAVAVAFVLVAGAGATQLVQAQVNQTAMTPTVYCGQYPPDSGELLMRSACYDGLKIADGQDEGASCSDYAQLADQATVAICQKAFEERKATIEGRSNIVLSGTRTDNTPSPSPTPSTPTPSKGPSMDALDETKSLTEYIDILHKAGEFANVDMNEQSEEYGWYINGAGKKQRVNVDPSGKQNSPAIIIINGGGWQANDQNDDFIRENKPDKNGRTQTGPTAKQRGYTVIELTYRLGSSGIYYMFEDVMRGIKHVRDYADEYDIDPNKIALWGDSAGGSLAVRAGASGKSGAKVVAGWSAPSNAYTAIFRSYKSLLIGMDHSTCIPTDLAGAANITDLMNGGSGNVAEYGQGLSSNGFNDLMGQGGGSADPLSILTQILSAGQYASQTGQNIEAISKQLETAYNDGKPNAQSITSSGLPSSLINLSSKKLIECIDNFNVMSPALFASPESTPMYLAGFTTDDAVGPDQVTGMRDKLHSLGIKAEAQTMPGTDMGFAPLGPNPGNHLDYDARFVCPTLNFIDSIIQPDHGTTNCDSGQSENLGSNGGSGSDICTSRVDSEIRLRNVQDVVLSAHTPPSRDVSDGGLGDKIGNSGAGTDTKAGQSKKVDGTSKNKPTGQTTFKSMDPSVGGEETKEDTSKSSSGSSGGGGGGSGSGGGACPTNTSGGSPTGSQTPSLDTPTDVGGSSQGSDSQPKPDAFTNIISNLISGIGGFGTAREVEKAQTDKPSSVDGGGKQGDVSGARGGAKFTTSKSSGQCQIDYSRAPKTARGANGLVETCGKQLSFITSNLGDLIHVKPVQMLVVPTGFSDTYISSNSCGVGARGIAYGVSDAGRIYFCEEYLLDHQDDLGMAVHEVVHLTQKSGTRTPSWVIEGTADYIRYKYEPNTPGRLGCGANDSYTTGYTCTAALFVYIERQYNKTGMVKNLHKQYNAGKFTLSLITNGTNKTIDQLFQECLRAECKG